MAEEYLNVTTDSQNTLRWENPETGVTIYLSSDSTGWHVHCYTERELYSRFFSHMSYPSRALEHAQELAAISGCTQVAGVMRG